MNKDFKKCLKNKRIFKDPTAVDLSEKELSAAIDDLQEAKDRYKHKRYKYAIHIAYYSYFHAARALIYAKGYRERSHYCLMHSLEELYVKKKKLPMKFVRNFLNCLILREDADYANEYSKEGAKIVVESAEEFVSRVNKILK